MYYCIIVLLDYILDPLFVKGKDRIFSRLLLLSRVSSSERRGSLRLSVCLDPLLSFRYTRIRSAEVAEQADARDSNSRSLEDCGFDSHLRHRAKEPTQRNGAVFL